MSMRSVLLGLLLIAATAMITTKVVSQNADADHLPMSEAEMEMMAKWSAYAEPGETHQHLAKRAGEWNYQVKYWMAPDAPPQEAAGVSKTKMILGGRFLIDHSIGNEEFEGQLFKGMGLTGYDNGKKKYAAVWVDNMGTGMMTAEGDLDASGKVMTFAGEVFDPMIGAVKKVKSTETMVDDDTWKMEMFDVSPDGGEHKTMEITYHRAK